MKFVRHAIVWAILASLNACYLPSTTNWYKFSGTFCGRKTLTDRACSVGFSLVTLPIQLGALLIDIPFSMLEFFVGWAPFKQPLLKTSEHLPEPVIDESGYQWALQQDPQDDNRLLLTKKIDGLLIDSYWVSRVDEEHIGLLRTVCQDADNPATCSSH
ncbi:MAG: hypothetical protein ACOH5I_21600 [Oligoflexus sp.]